MLFSPHFPVARVLAAVSYDTPLVQIGGFSGWCVSERFGGRGVKKWGASTTLSMLRHPVQAHCLFKVNPVRLYLAYRVQTKHCLLAPTGYTGHALLVT